MNRHSHPELKRARPNSKSGRGVTAVLGPTNTGKTHLAIERMLAQQSGMIGLPLRLLAREVYSRVVERVGADLVSLITGEEKIRPKNARFHICTVEAMPPQADVHFLAIDEVQLAADLDRGHTFTDRLLNLRGSHETMLLGAATLRPALEKLLPGINVVTRPRMSTLNYAGQKKITRLPRRSAIVAFSADEVYAIAELIRRQRGAAAVVLGSLSPRTRNAQVELYQSGDVDFIVATDAIGMGLNLDVDHVAFAQDTKFDGHQTRRLLPAEMAQIAGRAGRHTRDGTFGVTGNVDPFEDELIERLESHTFQPVKNLQWRNRDLDFSTIESLIISLEKPTDSEILVKAPMAIDQRALSAMAGSIKIKERVNNAADVEQLWQVAQIPDYRNIAPANHAELLSSIYMDLADLGHIDADWFAAQIRQTDDTRGEIDALSNRIAHIRTWTFISHRDAWLEDAAHWQAETRAIEDRLSDALHDRLTKRFVDRRTSVLMKRLRENSMLEAEIAPDGAVMVEGHNVGELSGFRFTPDSTSEGPDAKAARAAAQKALASEIEARAERLAAAPNSDVILESDGTMRWIGVPVGRLAAGDEALKPRVLLLADEQLTGPARDKVAQRLERWIGHHIETHLKPLLDLSDPEGVEGMARGVAFRVVENLGAIDRREVADDVKGLDQDQRATLRRKGLRFGAYHIFTPAIIKPAPAGLVALLWALKNDKMEAQGRSEIVQALAAGRTSMAVDAAFDETLYRLAGFRVLGQKAVRVDILERLADLIRPSISWRVNEAAPTARPEGAWDGVGFTVTPGMLSILGATHDDMADVLKGLGYRNESMLEENVQEKMASWDALIAPPATEEAAPAETAEDAPAAEAAPEVAPEAASEEAATANPSEASAEPAEPEEPKRIDVWRPGKAGGNRQRGNWKARGGNSDDADGKPNHGPRKGGKGGKGGKHGKPNRDRDANSNRKPAPKPKVADPDSPFAKLAALKKSLEGGDG